MATRPALPLDTTAARPGGGHDGVRLAGVLEAAEALGLTPDGVRARIRRWTLPARKGNDGTWRVELSPSVLARHDGAADGRQDAHDAEAVGRHNELLRRLFRVEERVDQWREELVAAYEARLAQARAEGEVRAVRAEGELAATRAMLEREIARGDRLEAALAEARRPWLAKVLEGLRRKGS